MKRAKIYIDDIFCGILTEASDGYYFKYDEQYMLSPNAKTLSPTMPFQTEEYEKGKNFSLLYKEGIGYTLSPAYDLLSVVLTGIEDNDELAMPLIGYGIDDTQNIGGIDKTAFIAAMAINGIEEKIANNLINKLVKNKSKWIELIDNSFLSMELKEAYTSLITERIDRLLIA